MAKPSPSRPPPLAVLGLCSRCHSFSQQVWLINTEHLVSSSLDPFYSHIQRLRIHLWEGTESLNSDSDSRMLDLKSVLTVALELAPPWFSSTSRKPGSSLLVVPTTWVQEGIPFHDLLLWPVRDFPGSSLPGLSHRFLFSGLFQVSAVVTSLWPWATIVQAYPRLRQPRGHSNIDPLSHYVFGKGGSTLRSPAPNPMGKQEGRCSLKCSEMAPWKGRLYGS